jgi:hypothetical protein
VSDADVLRIANCSGFYGDRMAAPRELVEGGPIDVLTGDYLAELTMLILFKSRQRDPTLGYATTFYRQMEEILGVCRDRGIKVVANAGGLNPAGLADRLRGLAREIGIDVAVAHVEGDDILGQLPGLRAAGNPLAHLDTGVPLGAASEPVSANAYLGGFGIAEALAGGPTSWSPVGSPTHRSWSVRPHGTSDGNATSGTDWPAPWRSATSSSAGPRPPVGTTPSSGMCPDWNIPAFPSPRWRATDRP